MNNREKQLEALDHLLTIMDTLREKCPWDRKQTNDSLRHLTLEESFELSEAILQNDENEIKKELGDLLLHIFFYSKIGSEKGTFDIGDVANSISEKLIYRHPHVYGDTLVADEKEVAKNWEALKLKEGNKKVLEGVPKGLPALIKAFRIQDKVAGVGFDWDEKKEVLAKVKEELNEWEQEIENDKAERIEEEFGDLLFSIINLGRFMNINPDTALEKTNRKFIKRFNFIEEQAGKLGKKTNELSRDEMEQNWELAKKKEA